MISSRATVVAGSRTSAESSGGGTGNGNGNGAADAVARITQLEDPFDAVMRDTAVGAGMERDGMVGRVAEREAAAEERAASEPEYPMATGAQWYDASTLPPTSYDVYVLEDGTVVAMDDDGGVVQIISRRVEYPDHLGHVWDGEQVREVYELEDGTIVVVDDDGDVIGTMDSYSPNHTVIFGMGEVEIVPMGHPTYDTLVLDADTGEVIQTMDTGGVDSSAWAVSQNDGMPTMTYEPFGEDYVVHIDHRTGEVVAVVEAPGSEPEPAWNLLGIVSGGNGTGFSWNVGVTDGNITIDEDGFSANVGVGVDGVLDFETDVQIDEDGTRISVDGGVDGVAEGGFDLEVTDEGTRVGMDLDVTGVGSASFEFEADANGWSFAAEGEVGLPGIGTIGLGTAFGVEDGLAFAGVHASANVNLGIISVAGEMGLQFQETEDGFLLGGELNGQVGAFGAYLERERSLELEVGEDGFEITYSDRIAAGVHGVGEVGVGGSASTGYRDGEVVRGVSTTVDAESEHLGSAEAGASTHSHDGNDTWATSEGRKGRDTDDEDDDDTGGRDGRGSDGAPTTSAQDLFPPIRRTDSGSSSTSSTSTQADAVETAPAPGAPGAFGDRPRPDQLRERDDAGASAPDADGFEGRVGAGPIGRPDGRLDDGPLGGVGDGPLGRVGDGPLGRLDDGPLGRVGDGPLGRLDDGPLGRVGDGPLGRLGDGPDRADGTPDPDALTQTPTPARPGGRADDRTDDRTGDPPVQGAGDGPRPSTDGPSRAERGDRGDRGDDAAASEGGETREGGRAEARAEAQVEAQERAEAEARALAEERAQERAQERAEAEARAEAQAEAQERAEAEARAQARERAQERAEAEARAEAREEAREETLAEMQAQAQAEAREKAREEARERAEAEARAEAREEAREETLAEMQAQAQAEAREKAREEALERAEAEAREEARAEAREDAREEVRDEARDQARDEVRERAEERAEQEARGEDRGSFGNDDLTAAPAPRPLDRPAGDQADGREVADGEDGPRRTMDAPDPGESVTTIGAPPDLDAPIGEALPGTGGLQPIDFLNRPDAPVIGEEVRFELESNIDLDTVLGLEGPGDDLMDT
jgi:hypothetical protein